MNAMREFITSHISTEKQNNISLVSNDTEIEKKEADKMKKEHLEEMLYYFYNHGGPKMDV